MRRMTVAVISALSLSLCGGAVWAAEKDERAGTCEDAKSQMSYFCDEKNSGNDTMVAIGTACENAKKNMAAACEGKTEADKAYKFDK